ncbi:ets variant gene 1, isoform CRA_b [Mus musculus]|nr:ets variant gene 1, isoform CRA_b [Mus musculus]
MSTMSARGDGGQQQLHSKFVAGFICHIEKNESQRGRNCTEKPTNVRKRKFINRDLAHDSEELFQDLSQLQETWLAEAQVPDNDEQFVPDYQAESLAFHGLPLKIKKEPHSPCSELGSACSQEQPFKFSYGEKCLYNVSAYDQKPQVGMRPSNPPTPSSTPVSPLHHASPNTAHTPKPDRAFPAHLPPSQSIPDSTYPMDHRFRRQLSEPCNSFPPLPTMPREGRPMYQRQMSEPNIPFPPQGFKQEYHDPVYEHTTMVGGAASQSFPPPLMIKQEPRDFAYDSEVPSCHSIYMRQEGFLAHPSRTEAACLRRVPGSSMMTPVWSRRSSMGTLSKSLECTGKDPRTRGEDPSSSGSFW